MIHDNIIEKILACMKLCINICIMRHIKTKTDCYCFNYYFLVTYHDKLKGEHYC